MKRGILRIEIFGEKNKVVITGEAIEEGAVFDLLSRQHVKELLEDGDVKLSDFCKQYLRR